MNSFGIYLEGMDNPDIKSLNKEMKSWDYGYIHQGKKITGKDIPNDFNGYKLMGPTKVEKHKIGTCWDYTSYEDYWFKKNNIPHQCWYLQANRGDNHSWLSYEENGKIIAFEASWKSYAGLHKYDNEEEMIKDYVDRSIKGWKSESNEDKVGGYFVVKFNQFSIDGMDPYDYMYKCTTSGTFIKGDRKVYNQWKDNRESLKEDVNMNSFGIDLGINIQKSNIDAIEESHNKDQYYRIVYIINCKVFGIYEAAKINMSYAEWKEFKTRKEVTWLPVPEGEYGDNDRSYFTKEGWVIFKKKTLPLLKQYLEGGHIETNVTDELPGTIIYRDRYQVLVSMDKIKEQLQEQSMKEEDTMLEASTDTRLLISQDDIYINFNDWKTKKSNMLFVIGLSGSGKSTLSNKMAEKYHAYRTETDTIAFKIAGKIRAVDRGHGTWEWIENADPMVAKYLRAKHLDPMFLSNPRFDVSKTKPTRDKESEEIIQQEVDKYIYWLCYEQKERVVLEGGHGAVCITRHEEMYRKMPIIIKGTSIAKSMLRRTIRDADEPRDLILRPFILLKQYSKMVPEMNRVRAIVLKDNDIEYIKEDIDMEKIYVDSEKGFISEEEYMNDQNIVVNEDATDFELSEEEQKEMDLIEREVHKWAEDARKTGR